MYLIVGTFTDASMGSAPGEGLYVFDLDVEPTVSARLLSVTELHSPSFLARHPLLPVVYTVERKMSDQDKTSGALASWAIDPATGKLTRGVRVPTYGAFTAHVNVSGDGKMLATSNPLGPNVSLFRLGDNGDIGYCTTVVEHHGSGARPRQNAPWPHSAFFDVLGRPRLFVCDLGLDRVMNYEIDSVDRLVAGRQAYGQVSSGAGPRHLCQHPNGSAIYVLNELDSTLSVFCYDAERGSLVAMQTLLTVPSSFTDANQPAEIAVSDDRRFVYVTNRGHESIAVFSVATVTGRLAFIGCYPCGGKGPRHISFSDGGQFAFVSNQMSGNVAVHLVNRETGALTDLCVEIKVPSATCCIAM